MFADGPRKLFLEAPQESYLMQLVQGLSFENYWTFFSFFASLYLLSGLYSGTYNTWLYLFTTLYFQYYYDKLLAWRLVGTWMFSHGLCLSFGLSIWIFSLLPILFLLTRWVGLIWQYFIPSLTSCIFSFSVQDFPFLNLSWSACKKVGKCHGSQI